MNTNTSTNVTGQGSEAGQTTNTPPNVGNSGSNVGQSTPTLEELQQQLADAQKQLTKFEDEAFKAREKERQRKQKELEDKTALEQRLKEQGEFKTLAEQLQTTVNDLQAQIQQRDAEIAKRDYEALRARVATKYGLAPELAIRLTGQTEEELNTDAAALKRLVGEQVQQAQRPGNGPGPRTVTPEQSRDQQKHDFKSRRAQSGAYGL